MTNNGVRVEKVEVVVRVGEKKKKMQVIIKTVSSSFRFSSWDRSKTVLFWIKMQKNEKKDDGFFHTRDENEKNCALCWLDEEVQ